MTQPHTRIRQRLQVVLSALIATAGAAPLAWAQNVEPQAQQPPASTSRPSGPIQQKIVPGMAAYTDEVLFGDVWLRDELKPRDRSLVTISVLISTGKTAQLEGHLGRALNNGVTTVEAAGVLTHLALYSGWPSAVSALEVFNRVYTARNIDPAILQAPVTTLPAAPSEAARKAATTQEFGRIAPKFTELTNDIVFDDLWRRSDLSPRDRSLVTIAALAAMGDADLLDPYLKRAIDSGLSRAEIAEGLTHLAFYAGWPKATKALSAVKRVLGEP